MAKFPRRGASVSKARTAAIIAACVVLAVFALSSRPDWLHTAAQTSQRPEGRSLRATGSTSASSTTSFFRQSAPQAPVSHSIGDHVLVLYLYDNRDPVWVENFNFFLQWGIKYNDGCSYIILVSEAMYAEKVHTRGHLTFCCSTNLHIVYGGHLTFIMQEELPNYATLPSNAQYLPANTTNCAPGFGMLSQAFNSSTAKTHRFKNYIFMNSYARGPFVPAYVMVRRAQVS